MDDELVDLVNEKGEIVNTVTKLVAHKDGLLHKTVISEIINSEGRMLLVRPKSHKQDAGQFVSPVGGHVRSGETNEQALKRETMEEVGIEITSFRLRGTAIFNRFVLGRKENHLFILYEAYSDELPKLGDEAEEYEYFTKEQIKTKLARDKNLFGDAFHFVVSQFYPELLPSP